MQQSCEYPPTVTVAESLRRLELMQQSCEYPPTVTVAESLRRLEFMQQSCKYPLWKGAAGSRTSGTNRRLVKFITTEAPENDA